MRRSWVAEICDELIRRGLHKRVRWFANGRVNTVTEDMLRHMRRAGCFRVGYGIESGNQEILKRAQKGTTLQQISEAIATTRRVGLECEAFYILGFPGETRETAMDTIRMAAALNTTTAAFGIMVPYPGTEVAEMARLGQGGYRLLSDNWADFDKHLGNAMELDTLSRSELERLQARAYLWFYLRNRRLGDLWRFVWQKRRAVGAIARKMVARVTRRPRQAASEQSEDEQSGDMTRLGGFQSGSCPPIACGTQPAPQTRLRHVPVPRILRDLHPQRNRRTRETRRPLRGLLAQTLPRPHAPTPRATHHGAPDPLRTVAPLPRRRLGTPDAHRAPPLALSLDPRSRLPRPARPLARLGQDPLRLRPVALVRRPGREARNRAHPRPLGVHSVVGRSLRRTPHRPPLQPSPPTPTTSSSTARFWMKRSTPRATSSPVRNTTAASCSSNTPTRRPTRSWPYTTAPTSPSSTNPTTPTPRSR